MIWTKKNLEIAASLHQQRMVSEDIGILDVAQKRYKQSLEIKMKISGQEADHHAIAGSSDQFGHVFHKTGMLDEAQK